MRICRYNEPKVDEKKYSSADRDVDLKKGRQVDFGTAIEG